MAGIELDSVTGGPLVSSNFETSVPGIFAGGNVLHVNDLVDNVTLEGEKSGACAANYAMGKIISKRSKVNLRAGNNVRYIVPQTVNRERMLRYHSGLRSQPRRLKSGWERF